MRSRFVCALTLTSQETGRYGLTDKFQFVEFFSFDLPVPLFTCPDKLHFLLRHGIIRPVVLLET